MHYFNSLNHNMHLKHGTQCLKYIHIKNHNFFVQNAFNNTCADMQEAQAKTYGSLYYIMLSFCLLLHLVTF
jgi:hypothetical protein